MSAPEYLTINELPIGVTGLYEFNFAGGYLEQAHVKLDFVDDFGVRTSYPLTAGIFVTEFTLQVPPADFPAGATSVRIYRETPRAEPVVNFTSGSRLTEANLDRLAKQTIFVAAEAFDAGAFAAAADLLGQAKVAIRLSELLITQAQDAAATATTQATNAAFSETAAAASQTAAATSATSAAIYSLNASVHFNNAQTSATAAETSATNAANSAANAANSFNGADGARALAQNEANNASASALLAFESRGFAETAAAAALASQTAAAASQTAAANSATASAASATTASGAATTATTQAATATTQAAAAATSATSAGNSFNGADGARALAQNEANNAAASNILALQNRGFAETAAAAAVASQTAAATSATTATTQASNASASASAAAASAAQAAGAGHSTGDFKDTLATTAPTGWVFASGGLIGNAGAAGATLERANADTQALYTLLWNNLANTEAPVIGGRGASAAADFAALKAITLPDLRGRVRAGRDAMGAVGAANRMTAGGAGVAGATLGAVGGTQTHTLTTDQIPAHDHTYVTGSYADFTAQSGFDTNSFQPYSSEQTSTNGSGQSHNNTQPTFITNVLIKL